MTNRNITFRVSQTILQLKSLFALNFLKLAEGKAEWSNKETRINFIKNKNTNNTIAIIIITLILVSRLNVRGFDVLRREFDIESALILHHRSEITRNGGRLGWNAVAFRFYTRVSRLKRHITRCYSFLRGREFRTWVNLGQRGSQTLFDYTWTKTSWYLSKSQPSSLMDPL